MAEARASLERERAARSEIAELRRKADANPGRWGACGPVADALEAVLKVAVARCPTCGGDDREGGVVIVAGPDEFGNYDADDCPDDFHA